MDSTHPTAGWERVGDRFYRKTQLYTAVFDLDLDLDNFYVAGAPYGGAVGVLILGSPFHWSCVVYLDVGLHHTLFRPHSVIQVE